MNTYPNHPYPVLNGIADLYEGADMSDVLLLACQHMLGPQLEMIRLLMRFRLRPENIVISGKCYSTNAEVLNDLRNLGCAVSPASDRFDPTLAFDDWFQSGLDSFVGDELAIRDMRPYRRIVVLDDGGFMHHAAHRLLGGDRRLVGIEQTSSGEHRIKASGITCTRHFVSRTPLKQLQEAPYIGMCGVARVIEHIRKRRMADPNILVLGLGTIGRQMAGRLLGDGRYRGYGCDPAYHDPARGLRHFGGSHVLEQRGSVVDHAQAMRRLGEFDVIVGASGFSALKPEDIARLHPDVSLISMSSSDREFPAPYFRKRTTHAHDTCHAGGRRLVNAGFPITFMGNYHEVRPIEIELTIAQLMTCVMASGTEGQPGMPNPNMAIMQAFETWQQNL